MALERIEITTGNAPNAAVIWLHGLGADGHDFEPIVPELPLPPERLGAFRVPARADPRGHDQRRRGDARVVRHRHARAARG